MSPILASTLHAPHAPREARAGAAWAPAGEIDERLLRAQRFILSLQRELRALEQACLGTTPGRPVLQAGEALLYIGGRPGSNAELQRLVQGLGLRWLHHAGGVTGHESALQLLLGQARLAVVPGDYLDDDSLCELEMLAAAQGVRFRCLRDSGAGALAAALLEGPAGGPEPARPSSICRRQG